MRFIINAGFLLVFLTIIIPKQANAFKYNNSYWVNIGESESIIFRTAEGDGNKELESCSWKITTSTRNETFELNQNESCFEEKYCFTGQGIENGECGLRINDVREADIGIWECNMTATKTRKIYKHSTRLTLIKNPLILEEQNSVIVPVKPEETEVNVTIKFAGNENTYFCWVIKESLRNTNTKVILYQPNHTQTVTYDYDKEKYSIARRRTNSSNIWESVLSINNFTSYDLEREYTLNVTNEFGTTILHVTLENEIQVVDDTSWLLVLGIILLAIFLCGTIALILWAVRKKRMLCFRRNFNYTVNSQSKITSTAYKAASTVDDSPEVQVQTDNAVQ